MFARLQKAEKQWIREEKMREMEEKRQKKREKRGEEEAVVEALRRQKMRQVVGERLREIVDKARREKEKMAAKEKERTMKEAKKLRKLQAMKRAEEAKRLTEEVNLLMKKRRQLQQPVKVFVDETRRLTEEQQEEAEWWMAQNQGDCLLRDRHLERMKLAKESAKILREAEKKVSKMKYEDEFGERLREIVGKAKREEEEVAAKEKERNMKEMKKLRKLQSRKLAEESKKLTDEVNLLIKKHKQLQQPAKHFVGKAQRLIEEQQEEAEWWMAQNRGDCQLKDRHLERKKLAKESVKILREAEKKVAKMKYEYAD